MELERFKEIARCEEIGKANEVGLFGKLYTHGMQYVHGGHRLKLFVGVRILSNGTSIENNIYNVDGRDNTEEEFMLILENNFFEDGRN